MLVFLILLLIKYVYSVDHIHTDGIVNSNKTHGILKEPNIQFLSEGGAIVTDEHNLLKENHTTLLSLEKEIGSGKSKENPSQPKKGADIKNTTKTDLKQTNKMEEIIHKQITLDTIGKLKQEKLNITQIATTNPVTKMITHKNVMDSERITTVAPHKPTILSFDVLANINRQHQSDNKKDANNSKNMSSVSTSSNTVPEELQLANSYYSDKIKNTDSHPGIVTPLVITILVVPVFAVLGYLALRRGHEAWKNRHYKRMDFLLDGMYND